MTFLAGHHLEYSPFLSMNQASKGIELLGNIEQGMWLLQYTPVLFTFTQSTFRAVCRN